MILSELKRAIDIYLKDDDNNDLEVVIPNSKPSMGAIRTTKIVSCNPGFDWGEWAIYLVA